jgi:hypothetical protein
MMVMVCELLIMRAARVFRASGGSQQAFSRLVECATELNSGGAPQRQEGRGMTRVLLVENKRDESQHTFPPVTTAGLRRVNCGRRRGRRGHGGGKNPISSCGRELADPGWMGSDAPAQDTPDIARIPSLA